MKAETLQAYQGRHVSVIVRGIAHPTSGILESMGETFIVINPKSPKVEKVIIETDQITSFLVGRNEVNDEQFRRSNQR